MNTRLDHQLVRDYLERVDTALADVPHRQARDLREQIEAHIDDALPPGADEQQIVALLERIGNPEEIAAEVRGDQGAPAARQPDGSPPGQVSSARRRRLWPLVGAAAICTSAVALGVSLTRTSSPPAISRSTFVVPAVAGLNQGGATVVLEKAGFIVATVQRSSDVGPRGMVIAISPPPGTGLARGSTVTLVVSIGPPPPGGP